MSLKHISGGDDAVRRSGLCWPAVRAAMNANRRQSALSLQQRCQNTRYLIDIGDMTTVSADDPKTFFNRGGQHRTTLVEMRYLSPLVAGIDTVPRQQHRLP